MDKEDILRKIAKITHIYDLPLTHRLYFKLHQMTFPNQETVIPFHGMKFILSNPRTSVIDGNIYWKGIWEPQETNLFIKVLKPGMVVADIGAMEGYYTILASIYVSETGVVHAFEPIESSIDYIKKNIQINNIKNIKLHEFALFDKPGFFKFEKKDIENRLLVMLTSFTQENEGLGLHTKTVVFDEWAEIQGLEKLDLVKMDIEGAELNVLYGMRKTIEKFHPKLFIEFHTGNLKFYGKKPEELIDFLQEYDYKITPVDKKMIIDYNKTLTIYCE